MIKIFICNNSSPELLELQYDSFKKYLQEDFEFIVFNGGEMLGRQPGKARRVTEVCHRLGIQVVDVKRDRAIESVYDQYSYGGGSLFGNDGRFKGEGGPTGNYLLQWSWERGVCLEKGPICCVHSDVFLIEPVKFTDYLNDHTLCAIKNRWQNGLEGFWEPLLLADMSKLPDPETILWWPSSIDGQWTDTGGRTSYYLKAHPELKFLEIGQDGCHDDTALDFHPARYQHFILGEKSQVESYPAPGSNVVKVLHYQSGSGWCTHGPNSWSWSMEKSAAYHAKKLAWARAMIDGFIKPDRSHWTWE